MRTANNSSSRSIPLIRRTYDRDLHYLVIRRGVGDLDHELLGDPLLSIGGFHGLEVEFLWRKDYCTPFVVRCYIKDGFENEVLFLLSVCGTGFMGPPPVSLHIAVAKPAVKTPRWRAPLLWQDLRRLASLPRGFEMLLTLEMRVPGAGDEIPVTDGAEYVDRGVFQLGSMPTPPKMGCVRVDILTNQAAALAELDQMIFSTVSGLTRSGCQ